MYTSAHNRIEGQNGFPSGWQNLIVAIPIGQIAVQRDELIVENQRGNASLDQCGAIRRGARCQGRIEFLCHIPCNTKQFDLDIGVLVFKLIDQLLIGRFAGIGCVVDPESDRNRFARLVRFRLDSCVLHIAAFCSALVRAADKADHTQHGRYQQCQKGF